VGDLHPEHLGIGLALAVYAPEETPGHELVRVPAAGLELRHLMLKLVDFLRNNGNYTWGDSLRSHVVRPSGICELLIALPAYLRVHLHVRGKILYPVGYSKKEALPRLRPERGINSNMRLTLFQIGTGVLGILKYKQHIKI
jgi:hypothetical protein